MIQTSESGRLCWTPKQRQDGSRPSVTNSDTVKSRGSEPNLSKKFLCECAQGSKRGRKFCSFSSRVNESIHGKKEQGVFSRETFHRFIASSEISHQQMQTVVAFSETVLKCHRETPTSPLHWDRSAVSHGVGQIFHCRGQV